MSKADTEGFDIREITVREYLWLLEDGSVTCEEAVGLYLARISELDQSTGLNSMVVLNPNALKRARELDIEFMSTGKLRKLHGVPVIVKTKICLHPLCV